MLFSLHPLTLSLFLTVTDTLLWLCSLLFIVNMPTWPRRWQLKGTATPEEKTIFTDLDLSWQFATHARVHVCVSTVCFCVCMWLWHVFICCFMTAYAFEKKKKISSHVPTWAFTCVRKCVSLHHTCDFMSVCGCVVPASYCLSRCHLLPSQHVSSLSLSLSSFCTSRGVCVLLGAQIISFPFSLQFSVTLVEWFRSLPCSEKPKENFP